MEKKFEDLVQLFEYLARNPAELEKFKQNPEQFLAQRQSLSIAETVPVSGAETEPAYFRYTPKAGSREAVRIDVNARIVTTEGKSRAFHVALSENVADPAKGLSIATQNNEVKMNFIDYSVVHVITIPVGQCAFREESGVKVVDIRGSAQLQEGSAPAHSANIHGYINSEGDFDLAVNFIPQ